MKRVAVLVVGILALGAMVWAQNPLLINGAGATFPYPFIRNGLTNIIRRTQNH